MQKEIRMKHTLEQTKNDMGLTRDALSHCELITLNTRLRDTQLNLMATQASIYQSFTYKNLLVKNLEGATLEKIGKIIHF